LSIIAFSKVLSNNPLAKLRMIGSGPLLGLCRDLAHALGLENSVTFLGECSHKQVVEELLKSRAFIQHLIQALDGVETAKERLLQ
jgi:glycosyltransferase involved in cell wall biosynthesis